MGGATGWGWAKGVLGSELGVGEEVGCRQGFGWGRCGWGGMDQGVDGVNERVKPRGWGGVQERVRPRGGWA